jgi:uncharacterized protein YraI
MMMYLMERKARTAANFLFLLVAFLCCLSDAFAQAVSGTYVTTADVHLRNGPGTNYEVITTIPRDVRVNVVGREGTWLKVESKHGGRPGYIDDRYARPVDSQPAAQTPKGSPTAVAGPYRTLREAELRDGPGLNYRVVARLPADIKVNVTRAEGDWLRVESKHGAKPGYIEKRDVARWTGR